MIRLPKASRGRTNGRADPAATSAWSWDLRWARWVRARLVSAILGIWMGGRGAGL